jgi:hypothetical protein
MPEDAGLHLRPIRILHVDNVAAFWTRMSRNYRYKYEAVRRHPAFTCVDIRKASEAAARGEFDVLIVGVFGTHPDGDFWCPLEVLHHIPRRALVIEDLRDGALYGGTAGTCECLDAHFHRLISTYDCDALREVAGRCRALEGVSLLPHHINTAIFSDWGLERTIDVLLYGNIDRPYYTFRRRLLSLVEHRLPNVTRIAHPTYHRFDPERCGEGLARLLNQSRIAVATSTDDDYLVAKFFEISACATVLAGSMATQGEPIWGGSYIRLDESMSDEEIVGGLKDALSDLAPHKQAARLMSEKIHREWSVDRYPERLLEIAQQMCRGETSAAANAHGDCGGASRTAALDHPPDATCRGLPDYRVSVRGSIQSPTETSVFCRRSTPST